MNIIKWWHDRKNRDNDQQTWWENIENPVYNAEYEETTKIIQDILDKLDEIKLLIDELKKDSKND
jgi:hypothetical protein